VPLSVSTASTARAAGVGCPSRSGSTSTRAPSRSAWCTRSPSTAPRSQGRPVVTSSAASVSGSRCRCATPRTTGTSVSSARAPVCCARRSRASPVCAGTRARPCGPPSSRARSCPTRRPGTSGSPPGCSTSPSGATTPSPSSPPTASRSASAPRRATAGSARTAAGGRAASGTSAARAADWPSGCGTSGSGTRPARHPRAQTDEAEVTIWLWSPEASPMDLRFYHDGMGQDTYPEQLEASTSPTRTTSPAFGTPYGIARTSELLFWAHEPRRRPPSGDGRAGGRCARRRSSSTRPAPRQGRRLREAVRPRRPVHPAKAKIEDHLDFLFTYYQATRWRAALVRLLGLRRHHAHLRPEAGTSGATTSAATPGTTRSSRPTCGSGTPSCAPGAPTSSASPRR
jgi:hypothetical protein